MISAVQVYFSFWIIFIRKYLIVEILIVPPETAAHTNCLWKKCWPCVQSIATYQTAQTTACNCILSCFDSINKPLFPDNWLKFLLNKVQVKISLASLFVVWIFGVSVLICSIVCVLYSDNDNLLNLTFKNHFIQCVLYFPCCTKSCSVVKVKILSIMHKNHRVWFQCIVIIWRREVNGTFSRVV